MYKPKPMTDADIDKYLANLDPEFELLALKAQNEYERLYKPHERLYPYAKMPEPRLGILWAIAGGLMFSGSIFYLIWILYGVYEKIHGGIR